MSPDPSRPPDEGAIPGEPPPGLRIDDDLDEPVPLFAPGSRDDGFGPLPPDDRGLPLGAIDPDAVRPGHDTAEFLAEIDTGPTPLPPRPGSGTADFLAEIDTTPASAPPRPRPRPIEEEDDAEDEAATATPWPMVLLGSYASAVTLALAWVLMTRPAGGPPDAPAEVSGRSSPSAVAGPAEPRARKVEPVATIPADRTARLGETLRVGSLEITPQDARRQPVILRRLNLGGKAEETRGKPGTIVLHLKLSNKSADLAFAPLDPAFVRQGGPDVLDCFAETPDGERIYFYPLAVESEMSIVGQDFGELRPGESRVVAIATAPDAPSVLPSSLSWRLRLRTGLDRVDTIGVAPAKGGASKPK